MAKFKQGEYVQCTCSRFATIEKHKVTKIISVSGNTMQLKDGRKKYNYPMDDFELVEYKSEFKTGDAVELVDNYMDAPIKGESNIYVNSNYLEEDVVYTISDVSPSRTIRVKEGNGFWMNPNQFKHVHNESIIGDHKIQACGSLTLSVQEDTMKNTFRTTHYLNDTPIESFGAVAQGGFIESVDAEIARLEAFSVKTKAIKEQIKQLKADLKKAVEQFDAAAE